MPEKKGEQNKNPITKRKIQATAKDLEVREALFLQILNVVCGPCEENEINSSEKRQTL